MNAMCKIIIVLLLVLLAGVVDAGGKQKWANKVDANNITFEGVTITSAEIKDIIAVADWTLSPNTTITIEYKNIKNRTKDDLISLSVLITLLQNFGQNMTDKEKFDLIDRLLGPNFIKDITIR